MSHFIPRFLQYDAVWKLLLASSIFALSACEHEVMVSYNCVPSGARIFQEGIGEVGYCPAALKYNTYDVKVNDDSGALRTNKTFVLWPSGASLLVAPGELITAPDRRASVTFYRPEDYPNIEKDIRFSAEFEKQTVTPKVTYVVSRNQDIDGFASLNRYASCFWDSMIRSVSAECQ
jgi:hypothetical protein